MLQGKFFPRFLGLAFVLMVGFCFAKAFSAGSVMGIILATVGLVAGIYCMHLFSQARKEFREQVDEFEFEKK
jgi:fatty acid desaturase